MKQKRERDKGGERWKPVLACPCSRCCTAALWCLPSSTPHTFSLPFLLTQLLPLLLALSMRSFVFLTLSLSLFFCLPLSLPQSLHLCLPLSAVPYPVFVLAFVHALVAFLLRPQPFLLLFFLPATQGARQGSCSWRLWPCRPRIRTQDRRTKSLEKGNGKKARLRRRRREGGCHAGALMTQWEPACHSLTPEASPQTRRGGTSRSCSSWRPCDTPTTPCGRVHKALFDERKYKVLKS